MATMRAKMQVQSVEKFTTSEKVTMLCVAKSGAYREDGSDEDNTFTKFSPSGSFTVQIANPALFGKINPGQEFYVDFTEAPK
jgi:hypothetical protein